MFKGTVYDPAMKLATVLNVQTLTQWVAPAFTQAGITTFALLKRDDLVRSASSIAYNAIPFPASILVYTFGHERFERLIFRMRDLLLKAETLDVSSISPEALKEMLADLVSRKS